MLVIGAAAALLLSAPALGAGVLTTEQVAITGAGSQQNPAIAVDPDAPLLATVVAEDTSAGGAFPRTVTASAVDWSGALWPAAALPHPAQSPSAGQPDLAWGIDVPNSGSGAGSENVYLVEEASTGGSICTPGNDGVFFSSSDDGGQHWDTSLPVTSGASRIESTEPAIAADRNTAGRVYIAYSKLTFADANCSGSPTDSEIYLIYSTNGGGSWFAPRRVSPISSSGTDHYRDPSLAVLPDGRVIVAFRNEPSAQVETETCTFLPAPPATNYCGAATSGLVGSSTVVGNVGGSGLPAPSVVAAGGRVTVAWSAPSGDAVRSFAAMSMDGGATFGPAEQIDPDGGGNQFNPRLAATAGGRVDVAYLWDPAGIGIVNATTASAAAPLPGATTEAWGNPVTVQAVGTSTALGVGRLGVATANALSPLPATVVAFTDTTSGTQDVHVAGLLHGTTAPVIDNSAVLTVSKNTSTRLRLKAVDADGDPLTWSVGAQPADPGSSVTMANPPDPARGDFTYKAANDVRTDTFEAIATDGVPGHERGATINVNVINDPPKVICTSLFAIRDQPRPISVQECVSDLNHDPVTMELDGATGGSVERVAGVWRFVPAPGSLAPGSVVIHASDPSVTSPGVRVPITILRPPESIKLVVPDARKTYRVAVGAAVRMAGTAVDAEGNAIIPLWNFGDGPDTARGTKVAHRFRRPGTFTVTASAGDKTVTMKVVVLRRAIEIVGPPKVIQGVLQVTVRTRAAGLLLLKADSRSQTIRVPAGLNRQTLHIQVTTGPLVRLTLRITPSKKTPTLRVMTIRRLVMISPLSAG